MPYPYETFTIVVVVSSETSLVACAPSSPGQPSYSRRMSGTRSSMLKLERQVTGEGLQSPVRFLDTPPLESPWRPGGSILVALRR
jgi:hypothetical protein